MGGTRMATLCHRDDELLVLKPRTYTQVVDAHRSGEGWRTLAWPTRGPFWHYQDEEPLAFHPRVASPMRADALRRA